MRNDYDIIEDKVIMHIKNRREGDDVDCILDMKSFNIIKDSPYIWHAYWSNITETYYIATTVYDGIINGKPKYHRIPIHRFILNAKKGEIIDHINHDTTDNSYSNLRTVTKMENSRHKKKMNRRNKSGYRNVSYFDGKWIVQIQINGKNTRVGSFDDVDEAGKFAGEIRKKYYGKFCGE